MLTLCLHSSIRLHGVMINYLSTGTLLPWDESGLRKTNRTRRARLCVCVRVCVCVCVCDHVFILQTIVDKPHSTCVEIPIWIRTTF
jgi:hypothetical protein